MKVFRGSKVSADIGKVISFNDETEMSVWDDDECNQYVGTDQSVFPPYMNLNDGLWAYEPSKFFPLHILKIKPMTERCNFYIIFYFIIFFHSSYLPFVGH